MNDAAPSGLPKDVRILERPEGTEIVYPAGRTPLGAALLCLFGLITLVPGVVISYGVAPQYPWYFLLIVPLSGFQILIGFGLLLLLLGVAEFGKSLTVWIAPQGLYTQRRLFGVTTARGRLPLDAIDGVALKVKMSIGDNPQRKYYRLEAQGRWRRPLAVGDGVRGVEAAESLKRLIEDRILTRLEAL
jgi:hypothetical protein